MKKTITKQLFMGIALVAMMLTTSMVANASTGMYLRGGYNADDPSWSVNRVEFEQVGEDLLSAVYPASKTWSSLSANDYFIKMKWGNVDYLTLPYFSLVILDFQFFTGVEIIVETVLVFIHDTHVAIN